MPTHVLPNASNSTLHNDYSSGAFFGSSTGIGVGLDFQNAKVRLNNMVVNGTNQSNAKIDVYYR